MSKHNPSPTRGAPIRARILDAAEHLLREGSVDFSMRDLASTAGVSFATPFNHFGSKAAIMHALSGRRIDAMEAYCAAHAPKGDAIARVLFAVETAVRVMLEDPSVNRVVMGWLGAAGPVPGAVLARSSAFWAAALGDGEGLREELRTQALRDLPQQIALGFRGALSFWTAGELPDQKLSTSATSVARALLMECIARDDTTKSANNHAVQEIRAGGDPAC